MSQSVLILVLVVGAAAIAALIALSLATRRQGWRSLGKPTSKSGYDATGAAIFGGSLGSSSGADCSPGDGGGGGCDGGGGGS